MQIQMMLSTSSETCLTFKCNLTKNMLTKRKFVKTNSKEDYDVIFDGSSKSGSDQVSD
jgi:hypothetical protein